MTDATKDDPTPTDTDTAEPGTDSTVFDWHGQEVERDVEVADAALRMANGDEAVAEQIFDDLRPEHPSDRFKVPAEDREATLVSPSDHESGG